MAWRKLLTVFTALVAVATIGVAPISADETGVDGSLPFVVTTTGAEIPADVLDAVVNMQPAERPLTTNIGVPGQMTATYLNPATPQSVRNIFDAAINEWSRVLQLSPNAPVEIEVNWVDLGDPNILGSARPDDYYSGGSLPAGQAVSAGLTNVLIDNDVNAFAPEVLVNFNSSFPNWNFELSPPAANQYDLYTVALHEIGHGLGFAGTLTPSGLIGIP